MPNDKWETPDIAGLLRDRDERIESGERTPISYHSFPLTGGHPSRGHDELSLEDDQYIIDPDYMEVLGLQWDALIKHRR
jgi:hypothetical protein